MICPHCGKETMALGNLCKHCGKEVAHKETDSVKKRSTDGIKKAISSTLSGFVGFIFGCIGYTQYAVKVTEYPKSFGTAFNKASKEKTAMTAYVLSLLAFVCGIEAIIMGSIMLVKFIKAEKTDYKNSILQAVFASVGILFGVIAVIYAVLAFFTVDFAYLGL